MIAITGADGFLGWHLSCRYAALTGEEAVRIGRADFEDPSLLASRLADVDTVVHLAGVNRASTEDAVETGNVDLAEALARALGDRPTHVVYANSVQAGRDSGYGRGKARAGAILRQLPGTVADVRLPNLFGEHGRPGYNSFVATFCHEVAAGRRPQITGDREIPLLHAQAAADVLLESSAAPLDAEIEPAGEPRRISDVLSLLAEFHDLYSGGGEIPDVSTTFNRDLFNTYRSYLFPRAFPMHPSPHVDDRGLLVEAVRHHGGVGQTFASLTAPGATRGNHYHLHKFERFMVISGEAEIALRRLFHHDVVTFRVNGAVRPALVDMPTLWTHSIRNVGQQDLFTVFWADQLLNPAQPDQYVLEVEPTA